MIGSHLIISAYGFWLPNDPRGSGSDFVRKFDLFRYGPATKIAAGRSVAAKRHDVRLRLRTKDELKFPPVLFTGAQARAIGVGFAAYAQQAKIAIWACSIMPDHVHLVLGPVAIDLDRGMGQLKGAATRQLLEEGMHPFAAHRKPEEAPPCCWARKGWKVFLDTEDDVRRSIAYVEANPLKERKPRQRWSFITPFRPNAR
jgi:REP element-mobilizing transposase RayT